MRKLPSRVVDPALAHQRLARDTYGAQTAKDVAADLTANADEERASGALLPRVTGTTDHDILMSLVNALRLQGIIDDQTSGPDVEGL